MKKTLNYKSILVIIIVLLILCVGILGNYKKMSDIYYTDKIVVTQYEEGTDIILKKIVITEKEEIENIKKYIEEIRPLKDNEMVNLFIPREIVIKYNDNIEVNFNSIRKSYCYLNNKLEKTVKMSHIPLELVDYICEKLK